MKNTMDTQHQEEKIDPGQNDDHAILCALVARLRLRDAETLEHSERVVRLSLMLGREFGLNSTKMKSLKYGSLLHDIGKIGVPDSILRKPGRLTSAEWNKMREHPLLGLQILSGIDFLLGASLVVGQHHERWDGNGYPYGLRGNEIDRNARIFAVADAFDAMTSDRVYHTGKSFEVAATELRRCSGQQFDPEVVEVFTHLPPADLTISNCEDFFKLPEILTTSPSVQKKHRVNINSLDRRLQNPTARILSYLQNR